MVLFFAQFFSTVVTDSDEPFENEFLDQIVSEKIYLLELRNTTSSWPAIAGTRKVRKPMMDIQPGLILSSYRTADLHPCSPHTQVF